MSDEVIITTPYFTTPTGPQSGTDGWTLYIKRLVYPISHSGDYIQKGKPEFYLKYGGIGCPTETKYVEVFSSIGGWVTMYVDTTSQNSFRVSYSSIPGGSEWGTTYKFRVITKSGSNIVKSTNTVEVTTYTPDGKTFPNLFPNAGLDYGYYSGYAGPDTYPTGTMEILSATEVTSGFVSLIRTSNKPSKFDIYTLNPGTPNFIAPYMMIINKADGEILRYTTRNKSVYKPVSGDTEKRIYFVGCRVKTYALAEGVDHHEAKLSIYVAAETNHDISDTEYWLDSLFNDYGSGEFVEIIRAHTRWNLALRDNDYYGTYNIYDNTLIDTGRTEQQISITDGKDAPWAGTLLKIGGEDQRIQLQFSNTGDDGSPARSVYVADMVIFDLTTVFGGDGGNILSSFDNSDGDDYIVTETNIRDILSASSSKWWDFDYNFNYEPPLIPPVLSIVGNDINVEIASTSNEEHGMDLSGYLPVQKYIVDYKTWKETSYTGSDVEYFTTDTEDVLLSDVLPDIKYGVRYYYLNGGASSVYASAIEHIRTPPVPPIPRIISLSRSYTDSGTPGLYYNVITIRWSMADSDHPPTSYIIYYGTSPSNMTSVYDVVDPGEIASKTVELGDLNVDPSHVLQPETLYYFKIVAVNGWGNSDPSPIKSQMTTSRPDAPTGAYVDWPDVCDDTGTPILVWSAPLDDGGSPIDHYTIYYGSEITSMTHLDDTANTYYNTGIELVDGDFCYFKVAAVTAYGEGVYSDIASGTYGITTEYVKIRGYPNTDGVLNVYFTQKNTSIQLTTEVDGEEVPTYLVLALGTVSGTYDDWVNIPAGTPLTTIKSLLEQPESYLFNVAQRSEHGTYETGWPSFVKEPVYITMGEDILGDYILLRFNLFLYKGELYDVHVSPNGLSGLNSIMIITDYTTDIKFYESASTTATSNDITSVGKSGLIWRINSSIVNNNTIDQEDTAKQTKYFYIDIEEGDDFDTMADKILNGTLEYDSLEDQINNYIAESPYALLYPDIEGDPPFKVKVSVKLNEDDGQNHLLVDIIGTSEQVEHEISCSAKNVTCFYIKTKPNCYFVSDNMYELRSFEDMYGRNKVGSSKVTSYTKRSYGFKFNLDVITSYEEDEASSLNMTPIPGMSSAYNIGLDVEGPTRTITINGIRVDNMNTWMFHTPYETVGEDGSVETGGIIYTGTSNWGWIKFMKAIMGTFQFIDGPYRLIMMTIPSSSIHQYVLDRNCKYQYYDGTLILQAGYEDMCYILIERFHWDKPENMVNAINYSLTMRRVLPLGSSL